MIKNYLNVFLLYYLQQSVSTSLGGCEGEDDANECAALRARVEGLEEELSNKESTLDELRMQLQRSRAEEERLQVRIFFFFLFIFLNAIQKKFSV